MESQSNLFYNDQPKPNNNNTTIDMNDQPPYNPESQFSPRTNFTLDSLPLSDLIDFHKKRSRKHMTYVVLVFGIIALIGLALLIASFAIPNNCISGGRDCSSTKIVFLTMGSTFLGMGILFILIGAGCGFYQLKRQHNDLNETENGQQPIVWRLDGEEWIRYLNYIHGPNRTWNEIAPLSCFCCRRSSYDRLMDRQHGYIVLYGNGLIIDELYFISFRQYSLLNIELLDVSQQEPRQRILGLRIYTYLKAGKNSRHCHFDVFAPSSVSSEQLKTIAQSYSAKMTNY